MHYICMCSAQLMLAYQRQHVSMIETQWEGNQTVSHRHVSMFWHRWTKWKRRWMLQRRTWLGSGCLRRKSAAGESGSCRRGDRCVACQAHTYGLDLEQKSRSTLPVMLRGVKAHFWDALASGLHAEFHSMCVLWESFPCCRLRA